MEDVDVQRVRTRAGRRWLSLAAAYALLLTSCSGGTEPNDAVARVEVNPTSLTLTVGQSAPLTARVLDGSGTEIAGRRVFWSSANATVASVSQNGIVTALAPGSIEIAASSAGQFAKVSVTSNARPISLVRVTPNPLSVLVGNTVMLTAVALDVGGNGVPGVDFVWSSSNNSVATVDDDGTLHGVAEGIATITAAATGEGVSGTSTIAVSQVRVTSLIVTPQLLNVRVGETATLRAIAKDAAGNIVQGRPVTWATGTPGVATVSQTGVVLGVAVGTAKIFAVSENLTQSADVEVLPVAVASVDLAPQAITVTAGQSVALSVTLKDKAGNVLTGRAVAFSSDNNSLAQVSPTGLVTTLAPGIVRITATSEGVSATSVFTITATSVSSLSVTPPSATIEEGGTVQLSAAVRDALGALIPWPNAVWQSGAPNVATVSSSGLVTGVTPGVATLTGSAPGAGAGGTTPRGTATVTVTLTSVASVLGQPQTATVSAGQTTPFTAALAAASGAPLTPVGRVISWRSLSPAIATIDPSTGIATGVATGSAQLEVSAASPGQVTPVRDTVVLTVTNVPVASVSVSPGPRADVFVGSAYQQTFTADVRDAAGNPLPGRPIVWTSSAPAVATVNGTSGVVTGMSLGTATITATVQGVTGSSAVDVTLVPVSSVAVAPSSGSLAPTQTLQLTATPLDAAGLPISGPALGSRAPTWVSATPAVATVSASGLVTAVAAGSASVNATFPGSPTSNPSTITVTSGIASVDMSISPADSLLPLGTATATATPVDAGGNPVPGVPGRTTVWTSSNPLIASVTGGGIIVGVLPGTATITATVLPENVAGSLSVRVLVPVASVVVTLPRIDIGVGQSTQATATAKDITGKTIAGRTLGWTSATPAVATVSGTGLVTGVALGSTRVNARAVLDGVSGDSPTLSVTAPPIASLAFQPTSVTMNQHDVQNVTLTAKDATGAPLANRVCLIASADDKVIEVSPHNGTPGSSFTANTDPNGRVDIDLSSQGKKQTVNVTATCETRTATLPVTVQ